MKKQVRRIKPTQVNALSRHAFFSSMAASFTLKILSHRFYTINSWLWMHLIFIKRLAFYHNFSRDHRREVTLKKKPVCACTYLIYLYAEETKKKSEDIKSAKKRKKKKLSIEKRDPCQSALIAGVLSHVSQFSNRPSSTACWTFRL